jgi:hypothetical protein
MRQGADFSQILDEKLDAAPFAWSSSRRPRVAAAWNPGPRPVFLFGDLGTGFTDGPSPVATRSGASPWTPVYGARPEAQSRPARLLTAAQKQAAGVLRGLGATLAADFTDAELKSVFRALARRFHPDRHPGSTEGERARLALSFATACDAYRTLTTTLVH